MLELHGLRVVYYFEMMVLTPDFSAMDDLLFVQLDGADHRQNHYNLVLNIDLVVIRKSLSIQ